MKPATCTKDDWLDLGFARFGKLRKLRRRRRVPIYVGGRQWMTENPTMRAKRGYRRILNI